MELVGVMREWEAMLPGKVVMIITKNNETAMAASN